MCRPQPSRFLEARSASLLSPLGRAIPESSPGRPEPGCTNPWPIDLLARPSWASSAVVRGAQPERGPLPGDAGAPQSRGWPDGPGQLPGPVEDVLPPLLLVLHGPGAPGTGHWRNRANLATMRFIRPLYGGASKRASGFPCCRITARSWLKALNPARPW